MPDVTLVDGSSSSSGYSELDGFELRSDGELRLLYYILIYMIILYNRRHEQRLKSVE